jgi:acetyl-CoA C-acetyltransferase
LSIQDNVVIVSAARTAIGSFLGALKDIPAPQLGSIVIRDVISRAGITSEQIDEVIMGNVLQAGEGQAPARQAALGAGLPNHVQCVTVNKVCGSGLKSVMMACQAILLGDSEIILAGGMENMSRVPYYHEKARLGYKMGHQKLVDGMIHDGLWDVYNDFHMGNAAELCAKEFKINREEQDAYALKSYNRAQNAQGNGLFKAEICTVEIPMRKADPVQFNMDEEPGRVKQEKVPTLKPVFDQNGTITAANSSSINDGAAAVLLMSEKNAKNLGLKPLAKIIAYGSTAKKPEYFTTAPADSIKKVLNNAKMNTTDIDLFEINEAFAVVSIINNRLLNLDAELVNVNGGAIALGHPIGASGTRILVTLLYALKQRNLKHGLASLCIGGGEASTVLVESLQEEDHG